MVNLRLWLSLCDLPLLACDKLIVRVAPGQFVSRLQPVCGINFCYQPPPRSAVPYAAALRGQAPRCNMKSRPARPVPPPNLDPIWRLHSCRSFILINSSIQVPLHWRKR